MIHSDGQEVFYDDDGLLFNIGFGNVIVVDNLPIVKAEMAQQLESEIRRVFSEVGVIKEDGFSMPLNPLNQKTLGRCFIEFSTRQVPLISFCVNLCIFLGFVHCQLMFCLMYHQQ